MSFQVFAASKQHVSLTCTKSTNAKENECTWNTETLVKKKKKKDCAFGCVHSQLAPLQTKYLVKHLKIESQRGRHVMLLGCEYCLQVTFWIERRVRHQDFNLCRGETREISMIKTEC